METKRNIDTFETSAEYYNNSFLNGNRTHVVEELKELTQNYPKIGAYIICDLNTDVKEFFKKKLREYR